MNIFYQTSTFAHQQSLIVRIHCWLHICITLHLKLDVRNADLDSVVNHINREKCLKKHLQIPYYSAIILNLYVQYLQLTVFFIIGTLRMV
jgi:hypothetical protein